MNKYLTIEQELEFDSIVAISFKLRTKEQRKRLYELNFIRSGSSSKVAELIRNHINTLPVEVKQDLGYYRYHMQAN